MDYIVLAAADMLVAINFAINKIYQRSEGASMKASFRFNSLMGLFAAIIFFISNGFKINFCLYSFCMAAALSFCVMSYTILGFKLLQSGTVAIYTLFLMSGGMLLPYVWGILFLHESVSPVKMIALGLILAGIVLSNFSGEKINFKRITMCIAVFVLNGLVSIISKIHQIDIGIKTVSSAEFVMLAGIFKFFFAGTIYLFIKKDKNIDNNRISKKAIIIILASAIADGAAYFLQLLCAKTIAATVLYPIITGGSIVFSAVIGRIIFKEKLSLRLIISICVCFIGTVAFIF